MKRSEIHDAAKKFIAEHAEYVGTWATSWERAVDPFRQNGTTITTDDVEHPEWDKLTPEAIVDFFQEFWDALPDSTAIHGFGFGSLCDIAENVFGFDDEDTDPTTE